MIQVSQIEVRPVDPHRGTIFIVKREMHNDLLLAVEDLEEALKQCYPGWFQRYTHHEIRIKFAID